MNAVIVDGDISYPATSGKPFNAWMGRGSVDIVVYRNWKEVARYTLVAG